MVERMTWIHVLGLILLVIWLTLELQGRDE